MAAANLASSDHMAEEEREGLTDFRRLALAPGNRGGYPGRAGGP